MRPQTEVQPGGQVSAAFGAYACPDQALLKRLFGALLDEIALDKIIPQQVRCDNGTLWLSGERIDLRTFSRVITVAIGKAAYKMVEVLSALVDPIKLTGVVTGPSPVERAVPRFSCYRGGHPYPNADSLRSAEEIIKLVSGAGRRDLVLFLLSGGGSAICEKPLFEEVDLADCHEFYQQLVTCGASILDVNFVRKHFSAIKGGRLAQLAQSARQVTLYVSDAPPGAPSNVASGPTMPDESSVDQCLDILRRTGLSQSLPATLRAHLESGSIPETLKAGHEAFSAASWHCLLSPDEAVARLAKICRLQGWVVETDLSVEDDWPLQRVVEHLLCRLRALHERNPRRPVSIVTGGEYSCPANGGGLGGRNQAFVLECVPRIAGRNIAVLSVGTDGIDGTSPAAGAIADGMTMRRAADLGLDPAEFSERSDSFGFFSRLGDAIMTGPTGNNVRDVRILVAW